jgi:putative addiction module component (TIGR02574 family)
MTKDQVLATAKALPKEDRLYLAMELWEAIHPSGLDLPLTAEQRADLDQRVAEDEANPQPAEEWTALRQKLLDGGVLIAAEAERHTLPPHPSALIGFPIKINVLQK